MAAWAQQGGVRKPAAPHYDVVALRVEFQPDTTRFTTGDGTFDGQLFPDGLDPLIDPLPHDAAYFEAHLAFLEDYVARVSDGQTQVTTHLVPEVVRLSQEMGAYSPVGLEADSDPERSKLITLIEEAWTTASQISTFDLSGFDPERTAFMIFHAGVGRDIELLGTVLDKTPLDLPSIFFSEEELARLGGSGITFNGMPVRQTVILPRTESRPGFNFVEEAPVLLELSINGLIAASFFNFLDVPDLFNTETGEPAIGPFGLMDPLGIFAYSGLFAPEPSAWTKYYLGWMTPQEVTGEGPETVTLQAAGLDGGVAAARVPISSAEYFLVENRNRDPEGDGLVLRVWQHGEIVEQRVPMIEDDFNRFGVEGFIGGVVVGVDNYDFALPGIDADDIQYEGVNADPDRRAVDLEEADSAQDLGSDNSLGAPFDFFFEGNPVRVELPTGLEIQFYENRLGPETIPDSKTNEGGPSFVVLEGFSAPGSEMTFVYRREAETGIQPLAAYDGVQLTGSSNRVVVEGGSVSISPAGDSLLVFSGTEARPQSGFLQWIREWDAALVQQREAAFGKPAYTSEGVPVEAAITERGTNAYSFTLNWGTEEFSSLTASADNPRPSSGVVIDPIEGGEAATITFSSSFRSGLYRIERSDTDIIRFPNRQNDHTFESVALGGSEGLLNVNRSSTGFFRGAERWTYDIALEDAVGQPVFGTDRTGLVGVIPVVGSGELLFLRADQTIERIDVGRRIGFFGGAGGTLAAFPVLVDLNDDGLLEVLTTYGTNLVAFTQNGAFVGGFPLVLKAASVAQPLVAELTDSGGWSVLVASTNGEIYAYDLGRGGALVSGFPLAVGASVEATPLLHDKKLYAVSVEGNVRAWALDNLGAVWWGQLYGNAQNHSYVALTDGPDPQPTPQAASLIVEAETYNWPNPIRSGQTYLRCMTSEDASVRITIIDAAGSLIEEMELDLTGGAPAEHLWQTTAYSGLYFARVTATSASGQTATKLIKMAIVR